MKHILILIALAFVIYTTGKCQNNTIDTTLNNQKYPVNTKIIKQYYDANHSNELGYIHGKTYHIYFTPSFSNPFLRDWLTKGTLYAKGRKYEHIYIAYDTYKDQFIISPGSGMNNSFISLNNNLIDSISLFFKEENYHLKKINFNDSTIMKNGFYEVSDHNKFRLYIKYKAYILSHEGRDIYNQMRINYIYKNNEFHKISRKRDLIQLFPEFKKPIKKKISSYRESFKKLSRNRLIDVLSYIESL